MNGFPARQLTATLLALILFGGAGSRAADDARAARIDSMKTKLDARLGELEAGGLSGVILVVLDGEPIYSRGLGYADCENSRRMSADHVFLLGSLTKEFMKVLAYRLASEGHFRFEDGIGTHIPNLPDHLSGLTIGQILDHEAGLPDLIDADGKIVPDYSLAYDYEQISRDELLRRFSRTKLILKPGEKRQYSNLGYQVLAALFELATGKPVEELMETRIFGPAGMTRTGYVRPDWSGSAFADGCRANGDRWGNPHTDGMYMADGPSWSLRGAGGLMGPAGDLSRYLASLKNGTILPPPVLEAWLKDRMARSRKYGERAMGPGGSNGIFDAFFYWLYDSDLRIIVLTNREDKPGENYGRELIHIIAPVRSKAGPGGD